MCKLMMVALALSGCSMYFGGDDVMEVAPDATPDAAGTRVYPCSLQDGGCKAAYENAVAICDRRYRCDGFEGDRIACIADTMANLCYETTCYADYDRFDELGACIDDYNAAACDIETPACHL